MDQQSQSRKWMILVATIWIQAFTGTNFDFSAYSTDLKSVLGISQLQLNYLAVASDLGKALGWSSGLALLYVPLWPLLFVAVFMGLFGYGLQWLLIHNLLSLPYFLVFVVCLMAGCSICWFNTVCFVLCIQNFPANRALALSLTISFNGVSPALYTLAANAINPNDHSVYLLLNAFVPLFTSFAVLLPIFGQPRRPLLQTLTLPADAVRRDSLIFLFLYFLAVFTGLYLLLFNSISSSNSISAIRFHLAVSILLLLLPLCIPGGIAYRNDTISFFCLEGGSASSFNINSLVDVDELDQLHKELIIGNNNVAKSGGDDIKINGGEGEGCCCGKLQKDGLAVLGEEHTPRLLLRRWDFWLYYMAYFCGGTIGLVYSNNLGQIAESLGFSSTTTTLLTLYSSFSFFGRLLSAAPDFMPWKQVYLARTGWLTIALVPMPIALFVVATSSGSGPALHAGTALIGLSSGFIFAAAVSITSELFGPNSIGVNHNILITNIPLGSLLYGLLAATIYDANVSGEAAAAKVCMGRRCYLQTFVWWGCFSVLGLASSVLLFIRTRSAYHRFELNRPSGCNNCINGAQMDRS